MVLRSDIRPEIGVDEVQWQKGHKQVSDVGPVKSATGQIAAGRKRLLWVGRDRTARSPSRFIDLWGKTIEPTLSFVCSDMRRPYLQDDRSTGI